MSATVTLTLSSLNAGKQVTYFTLDSAPLASVPVQADANGLVTLGLKNATSLVYLVTLPDGQYFHLPIFTTTTTVALGTIPIYPQGVPQGLEDITALAVAAIAAATGGGDVFGPASATNNHLAVFDGITGKLIKDGGAIPTGNITNSAPAGTDYTLQASDNGTCLTFSNTDPITVTVPAGLGSGFNCLAIQGDAGQVTFVADGVTLNGKNGLLTSGEFAVVSLIANTANVFILAGDAAA